MSFVAGIKGRSLPIYPVSPGVGGGGGGGSSTPLARLRWVDGNTTVPPGSQNGSESAPYQSPEAWLNTLGPPTSTADANTFELAILAPTFQGLWLPDPQTWTIPPSRNVIIREQSAPLVAPEQDFTNLVINWDNISIEAATVASLSIQNLYLLNFSLTLTDDAGSVPEGLFFEGGTYDGSINYVGAANLFFFEVNNAQADVTITPNATPGFQAVYTFVSAAWLSTNLLAYNLTATSSLIEDTGTIASTSGSQDYDSCTLTAPNISAVGFELSFSSCTFTQATILEATSAVFDGSSWTSFLATGGTYTSTTVVQVVGGFLAGQVPGANIVTPAGNVAILAINGVGATAGFTQGGNWYTATSIANGDITTITLLDGAGAGAEPGITLCVSRTDMGSGTLVVQDQGGGVIATLPAGSPGFVVSVYQGGAWVFQSAGVLPP